MVMMGENWLPIPGYEELYEISDQGRVKSCGYTKWGKVRSRQAPIIMRLQHNCWGYPMVMLSRSGQKQRFVQVHRLVLEAFVGCRPASMEGCHWDGDKTNNRLSNLRWDTKKANAADNRRNGVLSGSRGEKHGLAQLTDDDIRCIRAEPYFRGVCDMLARCFGISHSAISMIRAGKRWAHVTDPLGAF